MDFSDLHDKENYEDVVADEVTLAMYNDRLCCFFVRDKTGSEVTTILEDSDCVYDEDYYIVNCGTVSNSREMAMVFIDCPNEGLEDNPNYMELGQILFDEGHRLEDCATTDRFNYIDSIFTND